MKRIIKEQSAPSANALNTNGIVNEPFNVYKDPENREFFETFTIVSISQGSQGSFDIQVKDNQGNRAKFFFKCSDTGLGSDGYSNALYSNNLVNELKKRYCTKSTGGAAVPNATFASTTNKNPQANAMAEGKRIVKLTEGDLINLVKRVLSEEKEMTEACWKGYTKKGMKTMFGKKYPNCVKNESEDEETNEASSPAQQAAIAINMKKKGIKPKVVAVSEEQFERLFEYNEDIPSLMYEDEYGSVQSIDYNEEFINEAEYQGRKVQLGKIMQGDIKKSKVYVKNDKGKVVKVNFGFGGKSAHGKIMRIKKNNPERRRNFRARMNCDNPGPRWKPRYWACRTW